MRQHNQSLWDSLEPIIWYNRIFGLWPIQNQPTGYQKTYKYLVLTSLYVLLNITLITITLKYPLNFEVVQNSLIIKYLHGTYLNFIFTATIVYYIISQTSADEIVQVIKITDEVDAVLKSMSMNLHLHQTNSGIWKRSLGMVVGALVIIIVEFYVSKWSSYKIEDKVQDTPIYLTYMGSYFAHIGTLMQFVVLLEAMNRRFAALKQVLELMAYTSRNRAVYPSNEMLFKKKVSDICQVHGKLLEACRHINRFHSIQLFIRVVVQFMEMLGYSYITVYILVFEYSIEIVINIVLDLFCSVLEMLILVQSSSSLCQQVSDKNNHSNNPSKVA